MRGLKIVKEMTKSEMIEEVLEYQREALVLHDEARL